LVLSVALYLSAPWIASIILHQGYDLYRPTLIASVGFAGFAMTLQLPIFLYTGALAGLQRQDLANFINIVSTTLRYGGSFVLLWSSLRSVPALMIWQAVVAALTAVAAFVVLWRHLPSNHRWPRFQSTLLFNIWRFAAGTGGATLLGMLVLQSDKLLVGALLPLKQVGIYMVASVVASNLGLLAQPISMAVFPRLSQLWARSDTATIRATFRKASQLVSLTVLPVATIIAFFPRQTLLIWTGNFGVATDAAPVLHLLAIAVAFYALSSIPCTLILAAGKTRQLFMVTALGCVVVLPLLYFLTMSMGIVGAAAAMLAHPLVLLVGSAVCLRRLLGSHEWRHWIAIDVLAPQALIVGVAAVATLLLPDIAPKQHLFLALGATWVAACIAATMALSSLRNHALSYLRHLRAILQAAG
jgi:O-antigen/teichoic acid export membrane protein